MRPLAFLATALLAGCGAAPDPIADLVVPPLPDWTDRYADGNQGDVRFFNVSETMARYQLTRLQAVELQNQYRDLTRAEPGGDRAAQLAAALAQVKAGRLESGLDPAKLAAAKLIVVFDLDETLYDQYGAGESCHDLAFDRADGQKKHIQRVPGWSEAFRRIRDLGGLVVIFSANLDEPTHENLRHWQWVGTPLLGHPEIAGVLTNSHLVLQEKREGPGRENPRKGQPVVEPSKDLRLLDETLSRVIIVDDNPTRLFQLGNTRVFKKFHAPGWCGGDARLKSAWQVAMTRVVDEIEESVAYMDQHGVDFVTAWRPYSVMGQVAAGMLAETHGWSEAEVVAFLRSHPEVIDSRF